MAKYQPNIFEIEPRMKHGFAAGRISFFVLTLALRSGERGRLARCLWPPAKVVLIAV
jgi:hypothetical protein